MKTFTEAFWKSSCKPVTLDTNAQLGLHPLTFEYLNTYGLPTNDKLVEAIQQSLEFSKPFWMESVSDLVKSYSPHFNFRHSLHEYKSLGDLNKKLLLGEFSGGHLLMEKISGSIWVEYDSREGLDNENLFFNVNTSIQRFLGYMYLYIDYLTLTTPLNGKRMNILQMQSSKEIDPGLLGGLEEVVNQIAQLSKQLIVSMREMDEIAFSHTKSWWRMHFITESYDYALDTTEF